MWNVPEASLDTARSYIGRQYILRQFHPCRPSEDEPLKEYFTKISNYPTQWDYTNNAITNRDIHTQIVALLPSQYAIILMVLMHRRPWPTPEEPMYDLLEEESTPSINNELGDASMGTALFIKRGGYHVRSQGHGLGGYCGCGGHCEHGGSNGTGDSHESKCTYWKIDRHATDVCRKWKYAQEGANNRGNAEVIFSQCRLPGHVKVECIFYKSILEWWKVMKATSIAALATTRDCNPFQVTGCVYATALHWVIDFGASHVMCNDCSSISIFKMLSVPIVIKLRDNNSVTTMHYGLINVIQNYQVEAIHNCTFQSTLLSIKQLDLGMHTTIYRNGNCSITSPSSWNHSGNLLNGIYIIVPAKTLQLTTDNGNKRKRDTSLQRVVIAEPTIESTIELSAAPIEGITKSLTISESRLWHRWLDYMNSTALKCLVCRYTHDDSMRTIYIPAKHK